MLTEKSFQLLQDNLENILSISKEYGFTNVRIFKPLPSTEGIDIKFLVSRDMNLQHKTSSNDVDNFILKLQKLLCCNIDVIQDHKLDEIVEQNILTRAIPLSSKSIPEIQVQFGFESKAPPPSKKPKLTIKQEDDCVKLIITIPIDNTDLTEAEYIELAIQVLSEEQERLANDNSLIPKPTI